ncbi:RPII140-upstream gene protein [Diorhabda carinulata]|uniref:RPII140-upstream gene protein n=1 Tax=Diorhabda carinulata TaxID=1163345 RepID=UPI0025A2D08E|nr:RPII140-upstream gene protein [Diorhabda carinulata]
MVSILNKIGKYSILPVIGLFDADKVQNVTKTEQNTEKTLKETGWERVKKIFEADEFGNLTNEVTSILQVAAMSSFIGAIYGGVINSRSAYLEFMRSNEATSFENHLDAKRKLQDAVTISFGKGAFKWGWRITLFSTTFVAVSTIIQTYRGNYGISEYVVSGVVTGTMYKFNMGPRGWIVGGGLGGVLGFICGGCTYGLLKLSGLSMEEARYWQNKWTNDRSEYFRKGVADYLEKEDFAVIKMHNDQIGESGKNIDNLDKQENTVVQKSNKNVQ